MALKEDLEEAVLKIVREQWTGRAGQVIPEPEDLKLGNDAIDLDATILYADMNGSTSLVDGFSARRAAEVYKTYMVCAAQLIKYHGGSVTAYDGDRIMGTFIGNQKNTNAAKTALHINWALRKIVNPANVKIYGKEAYALKHVIGIDTSSIMACRIGVRNDNDIVWVGRAANYAAKLTTLNTGYPIYITGRVFDKLHDSAKYGGDPPRLMWEERQWTDMSKLSIYRSNWSWSL